MNEVWLPIRDFEGFYEVSNLGRVRALTRNVLRSNGVTERRIGQILKPQPAGKGYLFVCLRKNGSKSQRYVHRVVAEAFVAGDTSLHVNHLDCNKQNNHATNLEWTTRSGNAQHAADAGRLDGHHLAGRSLAINNPKMARKLTAEMVSQIREGVAAGETQQSIADRFGTTQATVSKIVLGRIWAAKAKVKPKPGTTQRIAA